MLLIQEFRRWPNPLMFTCFQPGTPGANFWMRWLLNVSVV
jgi:hypothetical protein